MVCLKNIVVLKTLLYQRFFRSFSCKHFLFTVGNDRYCALIFQLFQETVEAGLARKTLFFHDHFSEF